MDRIVGEQTQTRLIAPRRKELEGPNSNVTCGHPSQNRSLLGRFSIHRFASGDDRKTPGGGDAKCKHRLTNDIFPKHGPQRGAPISAPGELRSARAFKLNIHERARWRSKLSQQNSATVAEHREAAELVSGIGLGNGL